MEKKRDRNTKINNNGETNTSVVANEVTLGGSMKVNVNCCVG